MKAKAMADVQLQVNRLREDSLEKLTIYYSISIFFLTLIFVHRLTDLDWKDIYILDTACIVVSVIVVCIRKRLAYRALVYCYLGLGLTVAAVEFIGIGIAGMGEVASLFCIMLSLFYLNAKATCAVSLIVTVIYGFAFYEYVYAGKVLSENDMTYMSWHSAWIATYVFCVVFFVVIGMSVYYLQTQTVSLLVELEQQKNIINEQKQRIEHLANHDALTGLPSARIADHLLDAALERATQRKHKTAVLFLDLDGFKEINDVYGHDAGDEVLKNIADRIASVIRSGDKACRIGGDEFLLIVEKVEDLQDLEGLCQRLIAAIGAPLKYKNNELAVGVSIGAASYPDDGNYGSNNAKSLRIKADELMYQVKKSGKNNYRVM